VHFSFVNMSMEYYSPQSGGAIATVIMNVSRELLARGHEVTVLTRVNDDPVYDVGSVVPLAIKGRAVGLPQRVRARVENKLHRWEWSEYGEYMRAFTTALRSLPSTPDAVFVFNDFVSARYARNAVPSARAVVWLHNECNSFRNVGRDAEWADAILTCSRYIADWTAKTHAIPASKIFPALNGVDLGAFEPLEGAETAVEGSTLKTLFIGRIDRNKGPDIAADAVAALRAEGLDITLTVVGGVWFYDRGNDMANPFLLELKEKMKAAGAKHLGHLSRAQLPPVVREHDVALFLSRSNEPFGMVVLEAMASGCAVIASNRGGMPEAAGGAAMLVNPDDLDAVKAGLRALYEDRNLLRATKRKSLERAAGASWSECADSVEAAAVGRRRAEQGVAS
jgi:glycosyltransferase involved in cell wall biosynthesis